MWPTLLSTFNVYVCLSFWWVWARRTRALLKSSNPSPGVSGSNQRTLDWQRLDTYRFHTLTEISKKIHIAEMEQLEMSSSVKTWDQNLSCFLLLGGEEPLPAHVPAVLFPGHGVLFWDVVLLWGAFQRHGQRESGVAQSAAGNKNSDFYISFSMLYMSVFTDIERAFYALCFALQRLQVPNIPISKCAACLKPPVSEEDKLKRCTRCYRVGYCNQWVLLENYITTLFEADLLDNMFSNVYWGICHFLVELNQLTFL